MKWRFHIIRRSLAIPALLLALVSQTTLAQNSSSAQEAEKKQLQLELDIEKLKADIADNKRRQREAEKAEAAAMLPTTETKALPGTLDVKGMGSAGLIVALDNAREIAHAFCKVLPGNNNLVIYDAATAAGITSAQLLQTQVTHFKNTLIKVIEEEDKHKAEQGVHPKITTAVPPAIGVGVVTSTIKAFADLASMFKTNVSVSKTDFSEAKSLFITAMAEKCPSRIVSLGFGYVGELDLGEIEGIRKEGLEILGKRANLEDRILELKKEVENEKDARKKKQAQVRLDDLTAFAKQVDGFLAVIKPNDVSDKSLLQSAAKYLALAKRINKADVLDLDIKLEGLSIIKENIFSGQRLKLSGTLILWYRLHNLDGSLRTAGIMRSIAKPIHVDLRGDDPKDEFWGQK